MATNDVISKLVRDLEPVSPLALPRVRLTRWGLIVVPAAALVVAAIGPRADLFAAAATLSFQAHFALLMLAAVTSAIAALAMAMPGEPIGQWRRVAPVAAVLAWAAWLSGELLVSAASGQVIWPVAAGWGCVAKSFAFGVTPAIVLTMMLGRGAPEDGRRTMIFAGLAAAAVGALGVELTCPMTSPTHLLLWHAGPVAAAVVLAAVWGRTVLHRFSSTWPESRR